MHFLAGAFLSSLAVFGVHAIPTPDVAARDVTGQMTLCVDINAGGACAPVTIPSDAIKNEQGFAIGPFVVPAGTVCTDLGGCPSSARIDTPNLLCTLGSSNGGFTCTGTTIQIDSTNGFVNFPGALNDNLACVLCEFEEGAL
ncbi:hypothetical protein QBC47DRAFT_459710 [Echria macrotheca]|uniref:Uncharacterized protein n=1 Tax=Echria macrotheca TaxID=438768 RepID=A0AAJ0BH30_9PEZI|nr:hypothetical protein QBC47DRAFT_459710 [Echria macrotheca]